MMSYYIHQIEYCGIGFLFVYVVFIYISPSFICSWFVLYELHVWWEVSFLIKLFIHFWINQFKVSFYSFCATCPSPHLFFAMDWLPLCEWGGTLVCRAHTSYVSILWVCCVLHHSTSNLLLVDLIVTIHPCLSRDRSLVAHAPIHSDSRSACSLASSSVSISCARAFPNCWTKPFFSFFYLSLLNIYYLSPHLYHSLYIHTYNIIYYIFIYLYYILCTLIFRVCSDYPWL